MLSQNDLKKAVAEAAVKYVELDSVIGVGTGSTVNYFIDALAPIKGKIEAAVSSSEASTQRLRDIGIHVLDLNQVNELSIYVDGADEINQSMQMIKGGGGALTREKIVATAADKFICIVDESKQVQSLGEFPVAVEVLPEARSLVGRALVKLGGNPEYRQGFTTDHGNIILDVFNLDLSDALNMESQINLIPGVVDNGIFAKRTADVALVATQEGVKTL